MLVEEYREYKTTVARLEKDEPELWLRYRELDKIAQRAAEHGTKNEAKKWRDKAVRAHRRHEKVVDQILKAHRDLLMEMVRAHV